MAQNWIDSATAIIHAPSDIIKFLEWSEPAKDKMLSFLEYEVNHIFYKFSEHFIERTGISRNLLHITDYQEITVNYKFKSEMLTQLFDNIQIDNNAIFLCYTGDGTEDFFISIFAIILNLDKNNSRDVCIITPTAFDEEDTAILQKIVDNLSYHSYISINYITSNGKKTYKYINHGVMQCKEPKIIYYITPFPLHETDIKKINLIANYIVSTGDISFSDAISATKIPLMHKRKQKYTAMHTEVALNNFYKEKEHAKKYIAAWKIIIELFYTSSNYKRLLKILLTNDISCLATKKWQEIEKEFTTSIINNNKLEQIILNHINDKILFTK